MQFTKAAFLAALTAVVSANPLEVRNTDPNGNYPTCSSVTKVQGKPFYMSVVPYGNDPAYGAGYIQEQNDGQWFAGPNSGINGSDCSASLKPFYWWDPNGILWDNLGRQLENAKGQLQSNVGGGSNAYGMCSNGQLTYNGINTFYACQNGGTSSWRIYSGTQVPQSANPNCNVINLAAQWV